MYCVKCGVKLADTENICPLCNTRVYHPEIIREDERELYPIDKMPKKTSKRAVLAGAVVILFMIPFILSFFADLLPDGKLDWFGFVAGGIAIAYLTFAFPMWFKNPHPVIFVPCDFAAYIVYLLYVNLATGGKWFLTFAFPISLAVAAIVCTLVILLHYLKRGKLYIAGGSIIAFGLLFLMIEGLMDNTFGIKFIGWSLYPLITLALIGGLLLYLAINNIAREKIERKLFF